MSEETIMTTPGGTPPRSESLSSGPAQALTPQPQEGHAHDRGTGTQQAVRREAAVDGLNLTVQPGMATGFLGPNGAGKSTTMRLIAGPDRPTAGGVTANGQNYRCARAPMADIGVLLEAKAVHSGRSARNHLLALAPTNLRSPIYEFVQGNASAGEAASLTDFADKPLVVLTAGIGSAADHLAAQNHLATLSTNSAHRTTDSPNH